MATQLFANNAKTVLASGISAVATSLTVTAGTGLLFPVITGSDYFLATLCQLSVTGEINFEIVKVTARTSDVFTIVRAQEGTTALVYVAGDKVELRLTKETMGRLRDFTPTGTGAVTRTKQDKMLEATSVKDFGALGDGSTNDSAAFNAALTAHKLVFIPAGTYYLNSMVTIPANTHLIGEGIGATTLLHGTSVTTTGLVRLNGANAILSDLTVDGNYPNITASSAPGIEVAAVNTTVLRCEVKNMVYIGIALGFNHARAIDCVVTGLSSATTYGSYGIWGAIDTAVGQQVRGCIVTNTKLDAIGMNGIGTIVSDNYVSGCQWNTTIGGGQIAVYPGAADSTFSIVSNNYIGAGGRSSTSGLELNGWCHCYGNTIVDQGNIGIVLQAGYDMKIHNNVIKNCGAEGVLVASSILDWSVTDNTIVDDQTVHTQTYGISIGASCQRFIVKGNMLRGNVSGAILDNSTSANKIVSNNYGHIVFSTITVSASPFTFTNNYGVPVTAQIYSGTVSSVTVGGRLSQSATNCQVTIPRGAAMIVTYSSLPGIDILSLE